MAHSAVSTLVGFSGFLFSSLHSSYERDWFLFLPPCIPGVRSSQDCDPATVHCYHVFLSVACNWTAVLNELFCLAERNATYAGPLRFERNKTLTRKRSKRIGCVAPGRFSRRGTGFIFYFFFTRYLLGLEFQKDVLCRSYFWREESSRILSDVLTSILRIVMPFQVLLCKHTA